MSGETWRVFSVVPPAQIDSIQLGGMARVLYIENPTGAYWYLPDALAYVPPFQSNMIVRFPAPTQVANVLFQAPEGLQQAESFEDTPARFTYSSDDAAQSPGVQLGGTSAPRQTVRLVPTGALTTYLLPRPAPNGIEVVWFREPMAITTAFFVTLSAIDALGSVQLLASSNRMQLDQLQTSVMLTYSHHLPAGTTIRLLGPSAAGTYIRVTF